MRKNILIMKMYENEFKLFLKKIKEKRMF